MNLVQIPQIWVNSGVDTKMLLNFLRDLNNNLEVPWLVCVLATLIIDQPIVGCIAGYPQTKHPSDCSQLPRRLHSVLPLQRYICISSFTPVQLPIIISKPCPACYTSKGSLSRTRSEPCHRRTGWPERGQCREVRRRSYLIRGGISITRITKGTYTATKFTEAFNSPFLYVRNWSSDVLSPATLC